MQKKKVDEEPKKKHDENTKNKAAVGFTKIPVFGAGSTQGVRPAMEDRHSAIINVADGIHFFGVYDGHGGTEGAEYCEKKLHRAMLKEENFKNNNIKQAIYNGFLKTDAKFLEICQMNVLEAGATVNVCVITSTIIYVANAGDCRCILSTKNGKTIPLSFDHKPTDPQELKRIETAGYYVDDKRVDGRLAVSRAIGDVDFKQTYGLGQAEQAVTCAPDILEYTRTENDDFIIIACDGLWDVMTNEEASTFVRERRNQEHGDLRIVAQQLVENAVDIGSMDNVTSLVINL